MKLSSGADSSGASCFSEQRGNLIMTPALLVR